MLIHIFYYVLLKTGLTNDNFTETEEIIDVATAAAAEMVAAAATKAAAASLIDVAPPLSTSTSKEAISTLN